MEKKNIILDLSFDFAVNIVRYCEVLENNRKSIVANQLMRSGTSVGANIREAQNGESLKDFIHKFKIAAKELGEAVYWLEICSKVDSYPDPGDLLADANDLSKVVSKIISTCKKKLKDGAYVKEPLSEYYSADKNFELLN